MRALVIVFFLVFLTLAFPEIAQAAALPWETPLKVVSDSIKGPVAYAIALMGIVVAGATLIWGGEINEFVRRLIMLILVISLIVFASTILTTLFSVSG